MQISRIVLCTAVNIIGIAGLMVGIGGCTLPVTPDLPGVLVQVRLHENAYRVVELNEPPNVGDGAGAALAEQLTGCWAMYRPAGGEIPVPVWDVYQFDAQTREFVCWTLQDPFGLGLFQMLMRTGGTYEIVEDGDFPAIRFTTTEMLVSNFETGLLEDEPLFEGPEIDETLAVIDEGLLYLGIADEGADSTWWGYRAIDCEK